MPGKTFKVAVPKWLKSDPTETDWEIIRAHSYDYVEAIVQDGSDLEKPMKFVPGLIDMLKDHDDKFERVKPVHIKSTYRFIDLLRQEISNKIVKVQKDIYTSKLTAKQYQQNVDANDDKNSDDDDFDEVEEEGEDEQEDQSDPMKHKDGDLYQLSVKDSKHKVKTPIKSQSKKIAKKGEDAVWVDYSP